MSEARKAAMKIVDGIKRLVARHHPRNEEVYVELMRFTLAELERDLAERGD